MASVVHIGSATAIGGTVATITVGAGGVPAGSIIVLMGLDTSQQAPGTLADSKANSYSTTVLSGFTSGTSQTAICQICTNSIALVPGDTLTYTVSAGTGNIIVDACYVSGGSSVVQTNEAFGSSTSPTVSITPVSIGSVLIGVLFRGTSTGFVQASGFATPPNTQSNGSTAINGGNALSTSTTSTAYNPTMATGPWRIGMAEIAISSLGPPYNPWPQLGPMLAQ